MAGFKDMERSSSEKKIRRMTGYIWNDVKKLKRLRSGTDADSLQLKHFPSTSASL